MYQQIAQFRNSFYQCFGSNGQGRALYDGT
jgi:hypothetical protein